MAKDSVRPCFTDELVLVMFHWLDIEWYNNYPGCVRGITLAVDRMFNVELVDFLLSLGFVS